jgi:hypothetical protein
MAQATKITFLEGGRLPAGSKTSLVTLEANGNFLHLALAMPAIFSRFASDLVINKAVDFQLAKKLPDVQEQIGNVCGMRAEIWLPFTSFSRYSDIEQ